MPPFCFVRGHKRHLRPHLCYVKGMLPKIFHAGQTWHIEPGAALAAFSEFTFDLSVLAHGGKWADTGGATRKAAFKIDLEKTQGGTVAVIPLDGVMRMEDGLCSYGTKTLANKIREASADRSISAIVIDANTGGGEAIAGQELKNAIAESKKPVLFYAHFLASAGVMAALEADEIYAAGQQTEIGSIGVKAPVDNEMVEWYTQTFTDYYAETSENKSEEFRSLQNGDPSKLIAALNKSDALFMAEVKKFRDLKGDNATIKETLSGRMFFAAEAQKRGLIDGIKTKAEVIERAAKLANQYSSTGKPKKGKKMAFSLAGTALGDILGIKADSEQDDAAVTTSLTEKFTEMEASVTALTTKSADLDAAKTAAELKANTLTARVTELEALNTQLSEKAIEVNAANEALLSKVASLESDKAGLSTQLAALSLKSTAVNTAANQESDSSVIEAAAKKVFGGTVNVK